MKVTRTVVETISFPDEISAEEAALLLDGAADESTDEGQVDGEGHGTSEDGGGDGSDGDDEEDDE